MKDDALLRALRDAAKRRDEAKTGTPLDVPLGETFEAKAAARILAERDLRPKPEAASKPRSHEASRARSIVRTPMVLTFLAMAAAIALFVAHPWSPPANVDALPAYAMTAAGGEDALRGDVALGSPASSAAPISVRADARISLLLRPSADVKGGIDVSVYASRAGQVPHLVTPDVRVSTVGAVEVRGRAGDLVGDDAGEGTIVVVVARKGAERPNDRMLLAGDPPKGATIARAIVRIHD